MRKGERKGGGAREARSRAYVSDLEKAQCGGAANVLKREDRKKGHLCLVIMALVVSS